MGEGKVSLFSDFYAVDLGLKLGVYPTCVICSRLAFDRESLAKQGINLEDMNVYQYARTHLVPGKEITYTEFLSGTSSGITFEKLQLNSLKIEEKEKIEDSTVTLEESLKDKVDEEGQRLIIPATKENHN